MNATLTTDILRPDYVIRLRLRGEFDRNPAPRVYIADSVAEARSAALAEYQRQERALGEKRFAERGTDLDVDALYGQLNAEIMRVKTDVAREALGEVGHLVWGDVIAAMEGAAFSRHAGCEMCPCSPGVVAGAKLLWQGEQFDVWVEKP